MNSSETKPDASQETTGHILKLEMSEVQIEINAWLIEVNKPIHASYVAKLNDSDYMRWAEHRSTEYLKAYRDKHLPKRIKAKLQGIRDVMYNTPTIEGVESRKLSAAVAVLNARASTN